MAFGKLATFAQQTFAQQVVSRRLLPVATALVIAAGVQIVWVASAHAHSGHGEPVVNAAAFDGLVADDALCGPGGFRIDGADLCTHGPDDAPHGRDITQPVAPALATAAQALAQRIVCDGDGVSGKRVQVLYARPEGRPDRYAEFADSIRIWAADADAIFAASAHETGGHRRVRFVTTPGAEGGCTIDVLNVVLPEDAAHSFQLTVTAMRALGYTSPDRKYLIFMDANLFCGIASVTNDNRPGSINRSNHVTGYARVDSGCWDGVSVAHELTHTFGGIQHTAPNATGGWHCVDGHDVMCYSDAPYYPALQSVCTDFRSMALLDCNNDDYFHTNPPAGSYLATHWNVADSVFLIADEEAQAALPYLTLATEAGNLYYFTGDEVVFAIQMPTKTSAGAAAEAAMLVQRIELMVDDMVVSTLTDGQFTVTWQAEAAGSYTFTARAYDQRGASVLLAPLTIEVIANQAAPLDGKAFGAQYVAMLPLVMR